MSSKNPGNGSGEEGGKSELEEEEEEDDENATRDEGDEVKKDTNDSEEQDTTVTQSKESRKRYELRNRKGDKKDLKAKAKVPSRTENRGLGQPEPTHEGQWTGSVSTAQPKPNYSKDSGTQSKSASLGSIVSNVGILLGLAVVCIVVAIYVHEPTDKTSDFDWATIFANGVDRLQSSFPNQTERFWKILRNRGLAHLRNRDPSQPLVFLLAAPPPAHEWVDCLATKLAEKLDPERKRNLAKIDGKKEKTSPPDKSKKTMDNYLKEKFMAGHRVALIHHLELLPPPSPLLFYSYCDDQNAPHKHVAIIFTVHMPMEPSSSLSPKEAEGSVEKYLSDEVWAKDDKDKVAALLSRVADTVVLLNGESSGSAKSLCS